MLRRFSLLLTGRISWGARALYDYAKCVLWVAAVTIAGFWIAPTVADTNLAILYLLVVAVTALRLGRGPAIVAAVTSAMAFDFFFVPPYRRVGVSDMWYFITLAGLLLVALIISELNSRAREREAHSAAAYSLIKGLISATRPDDIVKVVADHLDCVLGQQTAILLTEPDGVRVAFRSPGFQFDDADLMAAKRAIASLDAPAPARPDIAGADYIPMRTGRHTIGLLGVKARKPEKSLTREQRKLIEAFAGQSAIAIERALLEQKARRADLLQEAGKLRNALLHSVSHNLRTPVASLIGILGSLDDDTITLDPDARKLLLATARREASRLDHLIENLLSMSRLEAGAVVLRKQHHMIHGVVSAALDGCRNSVRGRSISIEVPADLPSVPMDFVLIEQVLVNLIDNACRYSPDQSPIGIEAHQVDGEVAISVVDRGAGIPAGEFTDIFDRFKRAVHPKPGAGMGLGLSICKGFVEAHGGRIWAEPRPGGGAIGTFTLPAGTLTQ